MNKIQKISSYLLLIFNSLMVVVPSFLLFKWLFVSVKTADVSAIINFFGILENMVQTPEGYVNLAEVKWTPILKLLGFCADLIGVLPFFVSLFCLKDIFSNYRNGEIFTRINVVLYRRLGLLYVLDALLIKSFSQTLMILAVTLANPSGHRYLSISFGTPNFSSLFIGIVVIVISWVMLEASKLHNEHTLTI